MIDNYTVSGVNDSATVHTKLDLHMIDAFVAVVRRYFELTGHSSGDSTLVAKTYEKSAYRQIPVGPDHLKFAYFCICIHELKCAEVYR